MEITLRVNDVASSTLQEQRQSFCLIAPLSLLSSLSSQLKEEVRNAILLMFSSGMD